MKNLSYNQQQESISNDIWYDVLITLWNEDDDTIEEHTFITQYPNFIPKQIVDSKLFFI